MDTLIDWLGSCPNCGSDAPLKVSTNIGSKDFLYDGDEVECPNCSQDGVIETDDGVARVEWGDLPELNDGHDQSM